MKKIYLIRHSEPLKNEHISYLDKISNQEKNEKIPLSVLGELKALEMAKKYFNKNVNSIWTSTYERAISTAKYIANFNDLKINISSAFNERKLGDFKNIKNDFWLTQLYHEDAKAKNGESRREVKDRMLEGLLQVLNQMNDKDSAIIVSHATAITFLLMNWCDLKGADLNNKKRWLTFKNCDVINDSFNTPEIFQLKFDNDNLISIERIIVE